MNKKPFIAAAIAAAAAMTIVPPASASPISGVSNADYNNIRLSPAGIAAAHAALIAPTSYIVTLGARLDPGCTNPGVLNERIEKTAQLAHLFPLNPILVSGGLTQPGCKTEAQAMRDGLVARGIPSIRIILDNSAGSTVGNAQAAARMVASYGGAVVTSSDHLPRAIDTFDAYAPNKIWLGIPA